MRNHPPEWIYRAGNWYVEKSTYVIRGNQGCDVRIERFAELPKTGCIWGLNEENRHLKLTRNEAEYHQIPRRLGRYKRARTAALSELRNEQMQNNMPAFVAIKKAGFWFEILQNFLQHIWR